MNAFSHKNPLDLEFGALPIQSDPADSFLSVEKRSAGKFLIFFLNEEIYAVSSQNVSEVIVLPAITPLPKTPEWIIGITNLRGKIISVIDLPRFWNRENSSPAPKSKLVLLSSKYSDSQIAFAVDKIGEIIVQEKADIQFANNGSADIHGKIPYKLGAADLLDAEKLFQSLKAKINSH